MGFAATNEISLSLTIGYRTRTLFLVGFEVPRPAWRRRTYRTRTLFLVGFEVVGGGFWGVTVYCPKNSTIEELSILNGKEIRAHYQQACPGKGIEQRLQCQQDGLCAFCLWRMGFLEKGEKLYSDHTGVAPESSPSVEEV